MKITLRLENDNDYKTVENLTREMFWNLYSPGCSEHFILHNLRNTKYFIPQLDYVALDGKQIIGNIVYSTAKILSENGKSTEVLTFGPLCVEKEYQRQGIATSLINHTLNMAKEMGFKAVFIYGNPNFYKKFGFVNSEHFNVTTEDGKNFDDFMGLELYKNALKNIKGKLILNPIFNVDKQKLEEYDKQFPVKEKLVTETQISL